MFLRAHHDSAARRDLEFFYRFGQKARSLVPLSQVEHEDSVVVLITQRPHALTARAVRRDSKRTRTRHRNAVQGTENSTSHPAFRRQVHLDCPCSKPVRVHLESVRLEVDLVLEHHELLLQTLRLS